MTAWVDTELITLADLVDSLGGVPLDRIRIKPPLGTATEQDVINLHAQDVGLFELVSGVLVQKPPDFRESVLIASIVALIGAHAEACGAGIVVGPAAAIRVAPDIVRMPDVSFVSWERLPERRVPREPIPSLVPDLAIEVLSKSNTAAEIDRKLREYFTGGCGCAWTVDPDTRSVRAYTNETTSVLLTGDQYVTAKDVLPGLAITVDEIFQRAGLE